MKQTISPWHVFEMREHDFKTVLKAEMKSDADLSDADMIVRSFAQQ